MGELTYISSYYYTGRQMKASSQLHNPAALPPGTARGRLAGPEARLNAVARNKVYNSCQELNSVFSAEQPVG